MGSGSNALPSEIGELIRCPDIPRRAMYGQIQGLIEIAVEKSAPVVDAEHVPAHQARQRRGVEVGDEQGHVGLQLAAPGERSRGHSIL